MVADALIAASDPSEVGNKQRKRVFQRVKSHRVIPEADLVRVQFPSRPPVTMYDTISDSKHRFWFVVRILTIEGRSFQG